MVPLMVLGVVVLVTRLIGQLGVMALRDWAVAVRIGLAVMFCFTAVAHFNSMRGDMIAMVPPFVPAPAFMVTFTGVCEVLGAIGLLVPRTRRLAALALIVMLIVILPANIYAAQAGVALRGAAPTPMIPRIVLQLIFIGLLWWSGVRHRRSGQTVQHTDAPPIPI
jgi:uncharacterized membrane protein